MLANQILTRSVRRSFEADYSGNHNSNLNKRGKKRKLSMDSISTSESSSSLFGERLSRKVSPLKLSKSLTSTGGYKIIVDLNKPTKNGQDIKNVPTKLHQAIQNQDDHEHVEALLDDKELVNKVDHRNRNVYHYVAIHNSISTLKKLLANFPSNQIINHLDGHGWTPLHYAVMKENKDIVETLLNCPALEQAPDQNGLTPLHWAAKTNQLEIAKLLVNHCPRLLLDHQGCSPIHYASMTGNAEMTKLLAPRTGIPNAKHHPQWTPLHYAALSGGVRAGTILIEKEQFDNQSNMNASSRDNVGVFLDNCMEVSKEEVTKNLLQGLITFYTHEEVLESLTFSAAFSNGWGSRHMEAIKRKWKSW